MTYEVHGTNGVIDSFKGEAGYTIERYLQECHDNGCEWENEDSLELVAVTKKMQFEAGEGRHFQGGVNYIQGNGIYAEIEVPEGASEDYGYISMKQAIISQYPEAAEFDWWYDGQEDKLAEDASADVKVYAEKEED